MFKSKGFTAAFIVLSVLIVALAGVLIYLLSGKGSAKLEQAAQQIEDANAETEAAENEETVIETESETQTETEVITEESVAPVQTNTTIRALTSDENHSCPVINELISESGIATIVKAGDAGEGICFHVNPAFDDVPGNLMNFSGGYNTDAKIYIMDNGRPYLMYKTIDNYYVTSNTTYISYEPSNPAVVTPDANKIGSYGLNEQMGFSAQIFAEDGNNAAFSIYNFDASGNAQTDLLVNVIASYNADGSANFEYISSDGMTYTGTMSFADTASGKSVTFTFNGGVYINGIEISSFTLHKS